MRYKLIKNINIIIEDSKNDLGVIIDEDESLEMNIFFSCVVTAVRSSKQGSEAITIKIRSISSLRT
jgi:hypothetical protein